MKRFLFAIILCFPFFSHATHIRAGEITYRVISYLSFDVTVTIYSEQGSGIPTDSIEINWGDGTTQWIQRDNAQGDILPNGIKRSIYIEPHSYPGPLPFYIISVHDQNRINGIININFSGSVN